MLQLRCNLINFIYKFIATHTSFTSVSKSERGENIYISNTINALSAYFDKAEDYRVYIKLPLEKKYSISFAEHTGSLIMNNKQKIDKF